MGSPINDRFLTNQGRRYNMVIGQILLTYDFKIWQADKFLEFRKLSAKRYYVDATLNSQSNPKERC